MRLRAHLLHVIVCSCLPALCACSSGGSHAPGTLEAALPGAWDTDSLRVVVHTRKNTDATHIFAAGPHSWRQKMKMQRIRLQFKKNGTYRAPHWNLEGKVFFEPSGTWSVAGDTLVLQQSAPVKQLYTHLLVLRGDTAFVRCRLDFDQDGQEDDEYFSVLVKHQDGN